MDLLRESTDSRCDRGQLKDSGRELGLVSGKEAFVFVFLFFFNPPF